MNNLFAKSPTYVGDTYITSNCGKDENTYKLNNKKLKNGGKDERVKSCFIGFKYFIMQ